MAKHISIVLDSVKPHTNSRKIREPYRPFKMIENKISEENRPKVKKIFETAQNELGATIFDVNVLTRNLLQIAAPTLGEIEFDVDKGTNVLREIVDNSGIRYGISKFMQTVF